MLSPEEVRHIAQLARVGMTDADVERLQTQLSQILEHFEQLKQLDTEGVPPSAHAVPLHSVMRDDIAAPSLAQDEILANAPQQEEGSFRVRAILEF